jgi:hypothetical protein
MEKRMKNRLIGCKVKVLKSSSLEGCEGIIVGEQYNGTCCIVEFTYVPNRYFQLPCTQVIDKKHLEISFKDLVKEIK